MTAANLVAEFLGESAEDKIGKSSNHYSKGALDIDTEMEVTIFFDHGKRKNVYFCFIFTIAIAAYFRSC